MSLTGTLMRESDPRTGWDEASNEQDRDETDDADSRRDSADRGARCPIPYVASARGAASRYGRRVRVPAASEPLQFQAPRGRTHGRNLLEVKRSGSGTIRELRLAGELDRSSVDVLAGSLDDAIRSKASSIVVRLDGLEFIDLTGIETLFFAQRDAAKRRQRLSVRAARGQVARTLDLTGLAPRLEAG